MKWSLLSISQRFNLGVTLALAAWLMQLSVFLTPIFSQQIGIGHGICQELAVLAPLSAESATPARHPPHHPSAMAGMDAMDMTGMDMHSMAAMPAAASTQSPAPQHPSDTHQSHALCGFCLLFGHSVLPPTLLGVALQLSLVLDQAVSVAFAYISRAIPASKIHHPQGRAPPPLFVL